MAASDRARSWGLFWRLAAISLLSPACQIDHFLIGERPLLAGRCAGSGVGGGPADPANTQTWREERNGTLPEVMTSTALVQKSPLASHPADPTACGPAIPRELAKVSLPPYTIEPPDVLVLDAVRLKARPPYRLEPLDVLQVHVAETFPNQPIAGLYTIGLEGTINLGYAYGVVRVGGLTAEQAQTAIRAQLTRALKNPQVAVQLAQFRGLQELRGYHLVRPDGTISLGLYGEVYVTGMTILQAKCAVENHLGQFMIDPEISLDVRAFNSKVYYVISDCGGGEQVYIFPVTGNETVLDAVGRISGLPAVASKKRIWVARPAPSGADYFQILPVDWCAIARGGATRTNYQLFPGDRLYVEADGWARFDQAVARVLAPFQRLFGITLLQRVTVHGDTCAGRPPAPPTADLDPH